jgi:hypothetical protein
VSSSGLFEPLRSVWIHRQASRGPARIKPRAGGKNQWNRIPS